MSSHLSKKSNGQPPVSSPVIFSRDLCVERARARARVQAEYLRPKLLICA